MKGALRTILVVVLAGFTVASGRWFFVFGKRSPERSESSHRGIAARILGEYLARQFHGQPILVLSNPFTQKKGLDRQIYASEEAEIDGLREGVGNAAPVKVVFPQVRPEAARDPRSVYVDPKTTTPLSFLVTDGAWDALVQENPDRTILVSLIGLPVNLPAVAAWQRENTPKFALFLPDWRMVGNKAAVRSAFQSGKIAAAVMNKPGAPAADGTMDVNYQVEFSKRFLLVTAENFDSLTQTYPRLF